ncbi:MAG: hypothetical protein DRP66_05990 [Planctomycetota bacterium]|nr:MAG: hypothetical protein DRP66_05990 [Planctomycetota bacterium]
MKTKPLIIAVGLLLIIVFGLLSWRIFYLQYYCADLYMDKSYGGTHAHICEQPQRGRVLDSRGRVLAASNKVLTVFIDPGQLPHWDDVMETACQLQPILEIPAPKICDIVHAKRHLSYVPIKTGITEHQRRAIRESPLAGVGIESKWERYTPMERLTSHIVGFVGGDDDPNSADKVGLAGIERRYDSLLRGVRGENVLVVDARRYPIGSDPQQTVKVKNGSSLVLTIDGTIQEFARSALMKQYADYQAAAAAAIVMNPWNGAILAMVSLPDYNPSEFSKADPDTMRNRALTDPFEPGSIFKPIVAAIALDGGFVGYDEQIYCENGNYAKYRIGEWAGHRFGNLTPKEILTYSSNIGMAKIGRKMGPKHLYEGLRMFGFGARTGIDLPAENPGLLKPTADWSSYTVTRIPYGHEISVTAIQIIRAFAILANGGSPVTPHLVRAVIDEQGVVKQVAKKSNLAGQLIKPQVAHWIVRQALANVVKEGTGQQAALEKWQVFGKTGTANIAVNGRYDTTNYTASFVGGAPAENPAVVVLVSIRKPNKALGKGYSGGRVAAPVFREIMQNTLTYIEKNRL